MKVLDCGVVLLLSVLLATACNGRGPTAPTPDRERSVSPSPGPPAPVPSSPHPPAAFELTGLVTDENGKPLSGAKITVDFLASDVPGTHYSETSGVADERGVYRITFTAVPGAMKGPVGTDDAVAFAYVTAGCLSPAPSSCAHEADYRYVLSTTQRATLDFHLRRITRITAGESTVVTIAPDDMICVNNVQDMHPWPSEFVCRTVRIVAPGDGIMHVEATPVEAGAALPDLEVEAVGGRAYERIANPTSLPVAAGTEVMANVELPWGSIGSQSFIVKTSMAVK
jgi:hypothetical protein